MTFRINNLFLGELEPSATIGGCIEIFENVWPNCEETIQMVEHECANNPTSGVYWEKAGTIGAGKLQNIRTNKILHVTQLAEIADNSTLQNIHNQFYTLLLSSSNSYAQRYGINEPFFHEGYNLLKYSFDEEYKKHYDGGTDVGRAVSAICYLNDDYEGGEIEFSNFNVSIKPPAGSLILFPSNYAYSHISKPIISGTKYALVTWIHDTSLR